MGTAKKAASSRGVRGAFGTARRLEVVDGVKGRKGWSVGIVPKKKDVQSFFWRYKPVY